MREIFKAILNGNILLLQSKIDRKVLKINGEKDGYKIDLPIGKNDKDIPENASPLAVAVLKHRQNNHIYSEIIKRLLIAGANPHYKFDPSYHERGKTILSFVCKEGHLAIFNLFITHAQQRLNFLELDDAGNTLLALTKNLSIAETLVQQGVSTTHKNKNGESALHKLCTSDCSAGLLHYHLHLNPFAINDFNKDGCSPAGAICRGSYTDAEKINFLSILADNGADVLYGLRDADTKDMSRNTRDALSKIAVSTCNIPKIKEADLRYQELIGNVVNTVCARLHQKGLSFPETFYEQLKPVIIQNIRSELNNLFGHGFFGFDQASLLKQNILADKISRELSVILESSEAYDVKTKQLNTALIAQPVRRAVLHSWMEISEAKRAQQYPNYEAALASPAFLAALKQNPTLMFAAPQTVIAIAASAQMAAASSSAGSSYSGNNSSSFFQDALEAADNANTAYDFVDSALNGDVVGAASAMLSKVKFW